MSLTSCRTEYRQGGFLDIYIAPERRSLLVANGLAGADELWALRAEWFEEPNACRGGWSGVCRLVLARPEGGELGVFLKRQENHCCRSWRHPVAGEPTFAREFRMLRYLQKRGVSAPIPVFFSSMRVDGQPCGILMTEELTGYRPLDAVVRELFADGWPPLAKQRRLLRAAAEIVRRLHAAGVQHGALYPKHLFVRMSDGGDPELALIDLEKARIFPLAERRTVHDLESLNRHARFWSRTARLRFLLDYLGQSRLDARAKRLCRKIARRAEEKRR